MPLKILIVAEPGLLCQGLKSWLREDPELAVCGLACSELEALYLTYQLSPDLVLVDLKLAGYPRLIEALSQAWPPLPIVVFSADLEKARLAKALESGASGYLGQKLSASQLCQAVKAAAKSALMVRAVVEEERAETSPTAPGASSLSQPELEIVRLMAGGKTNREIVQTLGLREAQLKSKLKLIRRKLGLTSRTELALYVIRHDLADS